MKILKLLARGGLAIVLTAIVSDLIYALGLGLIETLPGEDPSLTNVLGMAWLMSLLMIVLAIGFAIMLAILVEIPKTVIAVRKGRAPHPIVQVAVTTAVAVGLTIILLRPVLGDDPAWDISGSLLGLTAAGVIMGVCSALFWRILVIRPALRAG